MGKEKYWCHKNDKISTMADFQREKSMDPTGVNLVKDDLGFREHSTSENIDAARAEAKANDERNRAESLKMEILGQTKTEEVRWVKMCRTFGMLIVECDEAAFIYLFSFAIAR